MYNDRWIWLQQLFLSISSLIILLATQITFLSYNPTFSNIGSHYLLPLEEIRRPLQMFVTSLENWDLNPPSTVLLSTTWTLHPQMTSHSTEASSGRTDMRARLKTDHIINKWPKANVLSLSGEYSRSNQQIWSHVGSISFTFNSTRNKNKNISILKLFGQSSYISLNTADTASSWPPSGRYCNYRLSLIIIEVPCRPVWLGQSRSNLKGWLKKGWNWTKVRFNPPS